MLKLLNRICTAALIMTLAGCATTITPNSPDDLKAERLNDQTGILVGSFTRLPERQEHVSHTLYFQQEEIEQRPYEIMSFHGNDVLGLYPRDDFQEQDRKGLLFAFALPAGNYHFVSYSLESGEGHWRPTQPFSVPFTVEPGKVNYVGDIQLVVHEGQDIFGMTTARGGTFHFMNARKKDLPLLKAKYPDIPWNNLVTTVPNSARKHPGQSVAVE